MPHVDSLPFSQPLKEDFTHPSPDVVRAYKMCYLAERAVDPQAVQHHLPFYAQDKTARTKLIHIRVLGHLLSQPRFLSDAAVSEVAGGIISCREDARGTGEAAVEALDKLGEFYRDFLLRPFHRHEGGTPDVSDSPSSNASDVSSSSSTELYPPGWATFPLAKDEVDQLVSETPKSYATAIILVDHREDHRCIVTRILDIPFAEGLHSRTGEVYPDDVDCLQFCHIIPDMTNMEIGGTAANEGYPRNVWGLWKRLGYTDVPSHLGTPDKIHSLENVMLMTGDLRGHFDRLNLWFEPVEDVPNRYRLCSVWKPPHGLVKGQEITFQSTDPRLPLPNREYLRIRAACCRVAHWHLSGASILFNASEEDVDSLADSPSNHISAWGSS